MAACVFLVFSVLLAAGQSDPLYLLRLASVGFTWKRPSAHRILAQITAVVPSCLGEKFDYLSMAAIVLGLPFFLDFRTEPTFLWGMGVIGLSGMLAREQKEILLVTFALAFAVYLCQRSEKLKGMSEEACRVTMDIEVLKKEEESLRTQISFQKFQKHPITSRRASVLISKIKDASKPTASLSGELPASRLHRDEDDESQIVHPSTDLVLMDFDTEGDCDRESSSSHASMDLSRGELSTDDIDYLITSVMTRDYMKWSDRQQKAVADVLSVRLDLRNVLSQKLREIVGASHRLFTPIINKFRRVTGILQENAEFSMFLSGVGEWNFDTLQTLKYSMEPLKEIGYTAFQAYSLLESFDIPKERLVGFLVRIENKYRKDNFYHNSIHAADVLNSSIFLLMSEIYRCGQFLELEVFGLLVAAIGHDVGHPGVNNTYLVYSQDQIALKYNDRSVLEQMHSALTFQVLEKQDSCIVASLTGPSFMAFRKVVVTLILGTDLQKHMSKQKEFEQALADDTKDLADANFRLMLLEMCLKCADLGHGAKDVEIHKKWTGLITKEFFLQGSLERKQGLPVSPICNRETSVVSDSQIGFLSFLVLPMFDLWEKMALKLLQEQAVQVTVCSEQTRRNISFWRDELGRYRSGAPSFEIDSLPPPLLSN